MYYKHERLDFRCIFKARDDNCAIFSLLKMDFIVKICNAEHTDFTRSQYKGVNYIGFQDGVK